MFNPFSYIFLFTQSHGQEKSSSYYDLFDFGVLFYRYTPILIFIFSFHHTTPILTVDILIVWADLQQYVTGTHCVKRREIVRIWWRTSLTPDQALPRSHWSFHQQSQYGRLDNFIGNPHQIRQGLATNSFQDHSPYLILTG